MSLRTSIAKLAQFLDGITRVPPSFVSFLALFRAVTRYLVIHRAPRDVEKRTSIYHVVPRCFGSFYPNRSTSLFVLASHATPRDNSKRVLFSSDCSSLTGQWRERFAQLHSTSPRNSLMRCYSIEFGVEGGWKGRKKWREGAEVPRKVNEISLRLWLSEERQFIRASINKLTFPLNFLLFSFLICYLRVKFLVNVDVYISLFIIFS